MKTGRRIHINGAIIHTQGHVGMTRYPCMDRYLWGDRQRKKPQHSARNKRSYDAMVDQAVILQHRFKRNGVAN
jgi:hypothetical protein